MTDTDFRIRTRAEQEIEARQGKPIADVLRDLYHGRRLSQQQMADELGVARSTVIDLMKRHGVETGYNRSTEAVA